MKFAVCTLGCKVNAYESEYVINEFKKAGYELTDFTNKADVYIINTCTVTNTSDQKSRKMIRKARRSNESALVVVMGCYSQIRENDASLLDVADVVIGNTNKSEILKIVNEALKSKKKLLMVEDVMNAPFEDMEISEFNTKTRAYVKIEDGCENYCTYCIIPYVRGKVRSKKKDKVIKEVKALVSQGHKEIVLTGIHTGHYGADLKDYDFSDLLLELEQIKGLKIIRISSIEITELNDKFLDTLKKSKKIANHLHIPLQAGSNHVLKLMNRKYDLEYYLNKINEIRKIRPEIAITTDVIVGFPKESDDDFENTIKFISKVNFAGGHVFPYSVRKKTPAANMEGQLPGEVKHQRSRRLIALFNELESNYYKRYVGKVVTVIPETYEDGYLIGHTDNYLKVRFKGCEGLIGKTVLVKGDIVSNNTLLASVIKKASSVV